MMTRSGHYYGPIPQEWHDRILAILEKLEQTLEPIHQKRNATFPELLCWDRMARLGDAINFKREDGYWIKTSPEHLSLMKSSLIQMNENWTREVVKTIEELIHEIEG
jgi:hypothetical protein